VTKDDIRVAARLALPHRRRRNPFDAPGIDEQQLDDLLGDDDDPDPTDPDPDGGASPDDSSTPARDLDRGDDGAPEASSPPPASSGSSDARASAGEPYRAKLFTVTGVGTGEAGKRSRAVTSSGRRIGAARGTTGAIHLTETIRAAAPHQVERGRRAGKLDLRADDLRVAVKEGRESNLVLFCVDASGSMAARKRMSQVKTAVLSLLLDAYQRRDKVGLITFRGSEAKLALPPTSSVDIAAARLEDLPTGGRTPLAEGLLRAAETLRIEHVRDPRRRPLLVIVTDGRATHGPDALTRAHQMAQHLAETGVASLVVDCEFGGIRLGLARQLAGVLDGEHVPVDEVSAEALTSIVRDRLPRHHGAADEGAA
jgi:magnesium chelatase subunit D